MPLAPTVSVPVELSAQAPKPLTSAELAHCLAGALAAQRESQRLAV